MIYLASQSPRRRELLEQIGVPFEQFSVDIDEMPLAGEDARTLVGRLALQKAQAGWQRLIQDARQIAPVLGSDTVVVHNGVIMGKPDSLKAARSMLQQLSGQVHEVLTAVALVDGDRQLLQISENQVRFRELSEADIVSYWNTGEPRDKAGAYGIQGAAAVFVEHLEGSYSSVMGLPLFETAAMLKEIDCPLWQFPA